MTTTIRKSTARFVGRKGQNAAKRALIMANLSHRRRPAYFRDSLIDVGGNVYSAQSAADTMARSPSMSKDFYKSTPASAPAHISSVDAYAAVVAFWGATGDTPGDMDGNGLVDIDDLTKVIQGWNGVPTNPPARTPCGTINLGPGDHTIENMDILWSDAYGKGINGEGPGIRHVKVINCRIRSKNYGLYFAGCTSLEMADFEALSGLDDQTGADPYCIRGTILRLEIVRGLFHNNGKKGCYRVYGCNTASVGGVEFRGGRVMLGGGASDERLNQMMYRGVHADCTYNCGSVQVYTKTELVDTRGTWNCGATVWDQGGKLTLNQPINKPTTTGGGVVIVNQ